MQLQLQQTQQRFHETLAANLATGVDLQGSAQQVE